MKTIYKYTLKPQDVQIIRVPKCENLTITEQVLNIGVQFGYPQMWCKVDTEAESQEIEIRTIGTGRNLEMALSSNYVGTYMLHGNTMVLHVFASYLKGGRQ